MGISIPVWSLLFYASIFLIWNVYTTNNKIIPYVLRGIGAVTLLILGFVYRGGEDGSQTLSPQWWGILGLIGWAYLGACIVYQLAKGKKVWILVAIVICFIYYIISQLHVNNKIVSLFFSQAGHVIHSSIVLLGILLSLIFFEGDGRSHQKRFTHALILLVILLVAGFVFRPYYQISKIFATPTWALYSAASCVVIFSVLYWLIDIKKHSAWTAFMRPAASNPLLTYIIPFIILWVMQLTDLSWPDMFYEDTAGIVWSLVYAISIMAVVIGLNKMKVKLQL